MFRKALEEVDKRPALTQQKFRDTVTASIQVCREQLAGNKDKTADSIRTRLDNVEKQLQTKDLFAKPLLVALKIISPGPGARTGELHERIADEMSSIKVNLIKITPTDKTILNKLSKAAKNKESPLTTAITNIQNASKELVASKKYLTLAKIDDATKLGFFFPLLGKAAQTQIKERSENAKKIQTIINMTCNPNPALEDAIIKTGEKLKEVKRLGGNVTQAESTYNKFIIAGPKQSFENLMTIDSLRNTEQLSQLLPNKNTEKKSQSIETLETRDSQVKMVSMSTRLAIVNKELDEIQTKLTHKTPTTPAATHEELEKRFSSRGEIMRQPIEKQQSTLNKDGVPISPRQFAPPKEEPSMLSALKKTQEESTKDGIPLAIQVPETSRSPRSDDSPASPTPASPTDVEVGIETPRMRR